MFLFILYNSVKSACASIIILIIIPLEFSRGIFYNLKMIVLLFLRLILGQIFLVHGWRKIVKKESDGTPKYIFLGAMEVIGALLMITGFLYQIAALIFIIIMLGAIYLKFFVWEGQTYVSNTEYDVLILLSSLTIGIFGPGALALSFFL